VFKGNAIKGMIQA